MMNRIAILAAAILPLAAGAQSADATLDRAASVYAGLRSVRAEFRQTLINPLTGTTATTSGTILRRKPNLLSISFSNGDRIVADGKNLWLYFPSSVPGQVIRQSAGAGASAAFDPAGELLSTPHSRYAAANAGKSSVAGRAAHVIALTPKSASAPFAKVKLWVDDSDSSVRQFEVTERSGLTRTISITRLAANAMLPRSAFSFSVPRGVRVVTQPVQQLN